MRFLIFLLCVIGLSAKAYADISDTQKDFMTSRGVGHKELSLYCTQSIYQYKKHFEAVSKVLNKTDAQERAEEKKNMEAASEYWRERAILLYGGSAEAGASVPEVSKRYIARMNHAVKSSPSMTTEVAQYSSVYLEARQCYLFYLTATGAQKLYTLESLKYYKLLIAILEHKPAVNVWDAVPLEVPKVTMSTNPIAPKLDLVISSSCAPCRKSMKANHKQLKSLVREGKVTLSLFDYPTVRTGFFRKVLELNQCVYRKKGAEAFLDSTASLADVITEVSGVASDDFSYNHVVQHGDKIVSRLEQNAGVPLSECGEQEFRDQLWSQYQKAAVKLSNTYPGEDRVPKYVWRGLPYIGDFSAVPDLP